VPDPQIQSPTDFEVEKFLREYDNPRGLSRTWLNGYLTRPKPQLAIDVIRAFDGHFDLERQLRRTKLFLGTLNAFLGTVLAALAVMKYLLK
jgi:hypothetical protein